MCSDRFARSSFRPAGWPNHFSIGSQIPHRFRVSVYCGLFRYNWHAGLILYDRHYPWVRQWEEKGEFQWIGSKDLGELKCILENHQRWRIGIVDALCPIKWWMATTYISNKKPHDPSSQPERVVTKLRMGWQQHPKVRINDDMFQRKTTHFCKGPVNRLLEPGEWCRML